MGLVKEKMRYFIIPLLLLVFVAIYPTIEYNIDCPTAIEDPTGNEDCTWTKMQFWQLLTLFSLTEYGFPPDRIMFEEHSNPDSWENQSIVPMAMATAIVAGAEWLKKRRVTPKFSKETTESLR